MVKPAMTTATRKRPNGRMRATLWWAGIFVGAFTAGPVHGEIVASRPDHMSLSYAVELNGDRQVAWQHLTEINTWWSSDHTYSGKAETLSLQPVAGGCWCETWAGGSVEHARVVLAMPGRLLRLEGGFGPLQGLGVSAILTFELKPSDDPTHTRLKVSYVVNGSSLSGLDGLAGPVDAVMGAQIANLAKLK